MPSADGRRAGSQFGVDVGKRMKYRVRRSGGLKAAMMRIRMGVRFEGLYVVYAGFCGGRLPPLRQAGFCVSCGAVGSYTRGFVAAGCRRYGEGAVLRSLRSYVSYTRGFAFLAGLLFFYATPAAGVFRSKTGMLPLCGVASPMVFIACANAFSVGIHRRVGGVEQALGLFVRDAALL